MKIKSLSTLTIAGLTLSAFAQSSDGFFTSNGVKIRYVIQGEGIPVVLIHGWMSDSSMWGTDNSGNTKLKGANGYKVIAIDCRGHGKSDKPHDPKMYGAEMANDVVRLLDHLKIKKAHLVGYSMGSFIVGKVAATHPERVLTAIYGGQAPILKTGEPSEGSEEVNVFAKAVEEGKGLGPYIIYVSPGEKKPTLAQANAYADYIYKGKDVKAFAVSGQSLGRLSVTPNDLMRFRGPTLFLYGGNESDIVKNDVAAAQKIIAKAEVKIVPGGTHITTLMKPEFAKYLGEFIEAHKDGK